MKRITVITLVAFVAVAFAAAAGAQDARPDGKALFLDKKCNTCHTIKAQGGVIRYSPYQEWAVG